MPKNRNQVTASAQAGSLTAIALSQTLGAAGVLLLNGALGGGSYPSSSAANVTEPGGPLSKTQILAPSAGQSIGQTAVVLSPPQSVIVASAGNDSGINWTVRGFDYGGSPLTETIAGGNIGNASTVNLFAAVTSISASGATAAAVTAGTGAAIYSPWLIVGAQRNEFSYQVRCFLGPAASANYDVQATSDINLMNQVGGFADDIVTVAAAQTGNLSSYPNAPWMGFRLKINSGGPVTLRILENRTA
jgi:hypothetical protein